MGTAIIWLFKCGSSSPFLTHDVNEAPMQYRKCGTVSQMGWLIYCTSVEELSATHGAMSSLSVNVSSFANLNRMGGVLCSYRFGFDSVTFGDGDMISSQTYNHTSYG